ncbi:uncharacterized protein LOC106647209 isoform X2 [Copidosoma floridanum]|uniref:uncharacterized protein LOC106647209 isoform X2 n=1 Tax=Copidosoma floridanum TaxID=29053 RepID=UPI0006C99045|nr:uncharacterized protein LOC106647209 isoform X2 [Copidosoma floridanum]
MACNATRRREPAVLIVLSSLLVWASAALIPPPWADPINNPCATQPRGWQLLYWPADGKCYKIFQIGAPCPETMELGPSAVGSETRAECRCPPGTAQSPRDAQCHPIFTRASCPKGHYFAPVPEPLAKPTSAKKRWGVCRESESCPAPDDLFWPRDGKCYPRHSRGPCPKGELLILDREDGLAKCSCSREGELGKYYAPVAAGCYEHFTRGPCQEPGELFLPGGKCGCRPDMLEYYPPTGMCYQLGGPGPCPAGHRFVMRPHHNASNEEEEEEEGRVAHAGCSCKPNYVRYEDGLCYKLYTKGPCEPGDMLANATSCVPVPCRRGRLYFPRERTCYKIGSRDPCSHGQIVLYDYSASPSVDGISYNGVCGCTSSLKSSGRCRDNDGTDAVLVNGTLSSSSSCEDKPGVVMMNNGTCYKLYTRGPCEEGEWLVARRTPRVAELAEGVGSDVLPKARCECRPGYTRTNELESNGLLTTVSGKCQAPIVGIAKFLNENARAARF